MNNQGQLGIVSYFAGLIVFGFFWALGGGAWLQQVGQDAINVNSLTGVEAFFMANLNIWIFLILLISTFIVVRFGGGE